MEEHGLTVQRAQHLASRGEGYLHCGRVSEGLALLEEALKAAKAKKVMFDLAQILLYLAEGYLIAGRPEEALPCAREALKLARERAERGFEGWALHLIGEIVSDKDPHALDTCEIHYRSAIGLFEEIGARPWLARCHLGFGAFYRRTGRKEAEGHLTRAVGMFGQMGMRYWLERAEKQMEELD
jgi:tetratricopeptide (TPR) repeat protein